MVCCFLYRCMLHWFILFLGDGWMYAKDLLRYRRVWLGIALIWVILFHCPLDFGLLSYFRAIGYGGVDICLFTSGIGCFYSLSSDSDVVGFMKRRVKKLMPTYIVFILLSIHEREFWFSNGCW